MYSIKAYSQNYDDILAEIFFECSTQKIFSSSSKKRLFKQKYLDHYLENHPEFCFLLFKQEVVCGYIIGTLDTLRRFDYSEVFPYYDNIKDSIIKYPSHLHINILPSEQGKGQGRALLLELENKFARGLSPGVHIFTSLDASNVKFYKSCGYEDTRNVLYQGSELLFMGKSLISKP